MCLNPRKSLKTKRKSSKLQKKIDFQQKPDFLVI